VETFPKSQFTFTGGPGGQLCPCGSEIRGGLEKRSKGDVAGVGETWTEATGDRAGLMGPPFVEGRPCVANCG